MKVKLQLMVEETLKENFAKACEKVGLDMSEVIRNKMYEFTKENGGIKMNIDRMIEHLQEMNKVIVSDMSMSEIKEAQKELEQRGYITEFRSTDRDYLVLVENKNTEE